MPWFGLYLQGRLLVVVRSFEQRCDCVYSNTASDLFISWPQTGVADWPFRGACQAHLDSTCCLPALSTQPDVSRSAGPPPALWLRLYGGCAQQCEQLGCCLCCVTLLSPCCCSTPASPQHTCIGAVGAQAIQPWKLAVLCCSSVCTNGCGMHSMHYMALLRWQYLWPRGHVWALHMLLLGVLCCAVLGPKAMFQGDRPARRSCCACCSGL